MKKRDSYNHIDRNHTAINGNYQEQQRTNIVSPDDFFLGQLWVQEQETNGVKIIELDSNSSNNNINGDEDKQPLSHAWSYINNDRFRMQESPKHDYEVNHAAREKHRQNTTRYDREASSLEDEEGEDNCITDFLYSNFKEFDNHVNGPFRSRRKVNCFTETFPYPKTSDSSTDVEYIDPNDLRKELMSWDTDDRLYDEILTCDSNIDTDKRTIYIYSFKNKHLFTGNEDINISNGSSSTNTDVEESVKDKTNGRVSSPIPDLYVPRLNLIQTPKLPTVTEIAEPKNSAESLKLKYDTKLPKNGWFLNTPRYQNERHSDNLINWMSLSPREKRRRSRSTFCENCRHQARLQMVKETSPVAEADTQTTVESALPLIGDISPQILVINHGTDDKLQSDDDNYADKENREEDRGDHVLNKSMLKPKIRISPKTSGDTIKITEPIEKLDSNNWIGDETLVVKKKSSHQFQKTDEADDGFIEEDDVSRRLWENNMVLLKPAEWSAYFPVDNSVPSLHLSLETEIEEVTWCKRIIRWLKCFR